MISLASASASVAQANGQPELVRDHLDTALRLARESGSTEACVYPLGNLGHADNALGRYEQALESLQEGLTLARALGERIALCWMLTIVAYTYLRLGNATAAAGALREALPELLDGDRRFDLIFGLVVAADVANTTGDPCLAAKLSGASGKLGADTGVLKDDYDRMIEERVLTECRLALGDDAFEAAYAEGRALSIQEAVESATLLLDACGNPD